MPIRTLAPGDARAALGSEPGAVLLDVRTVAEYEQGHPEGAVNVPWAIVDPRSTSPTARA